MKIFRKIRNRLLSESKFAKYLIYAFGEIVLVVIGILIALAINTSQQKKVLAEKEQVYLKGLQDEFEISKLKLNELIKVNKQNYLGAKQILEYTSNPSETPTEREFSELLFSSFASDIAFNPNNSLLNEMTNSGSLKDISNTDLRILLTTWTSTLEDVSRQEEELGNQRVKVLDMFRTNENSIRTIYEQTNPDSEIGLLKSESVISNLNLLRSVEFENNMLMFYLTTDAMETSHYDPLLEILNSILELIKIEISELR